MSPDKDINNIEEVTGVVQDDPSKRKDVLKFPEAGSSNDEDQVVHDSKVDDNQPLVIVILARVKC